MEIEVVIGVVAGLVWAAVGVANLFVVKKWERRQREQGIFTTKEPLLGVAGSVFVAMIGPIGLLIVGVFNLLERIFLWKEKKNQAAQK